MQPCDLHDALKLPYKTQYSLTTTKSRAGDGVQGMTVETENVSLVPKVPCWPADSSVHAAHKTDSVVSAAQKKDSIVSTSSKGKGKEKAKERGLSTSSIFVNNDQEPVQPRAKPDDGSSPSPPKSSTDSISSEEFSVSNFLDADCRPFGSSLTNTTSHMSRFSAYGVQDPGPTPDHLEGEWWLEKKRRLSRTSFVSPAGRRASMASYGVVEPVESVRNVLCKKCFNPRASPVTVESRRERAKSLVYLIVANMMFPLVGLGLVGWSYMYPDQGATFFVSVYLCSLWASFETDPLVPHSSP